ncbi:MAG: DPP IV N-terminal domain-containing protein, partial [Candidatus Marinimicrobia bacterium]|nr:DPP IV N-terminal domain-containing protein [Candidatus Neomarinimicrobiota bacterium]
MKKVFLSVLLVLFISCAKQPSVQVQTYSIEQFYKNISIWGGAFSPDESQLLVTSNETGIYNVYALSVADGQMEALTSSETESQFAISYFPNDKRVLFSADKGGNENNHIYLLNEDKSVLDITPFENSKSQFYSWSHDKESFFFASNQRNPKFFDLYEKRIDQLENLESYTLVFQNDEGFDLG